MRYPLSMWSVVVFLTLLKHTGGSITRESKKNLHNHMTKREIEYYFGVKDHSEIPEYDVTTPRETESNGRVTSYFRRRRSASHPDVMHYKLHAFGSKLQLRLRRNMELMAPNLVIETHHGDGVVTTHPAPRNKFYLGKVSSDPGSLVAMRSDRGLTGMVKTAGDTLFVQPLPAHLAKRVRRSAADTVPHLIYRASPLKQDASGCQTHNMESASDRVERSRFTNRRKPRAANDDSNNGFKYIEAALIAPQHYVDKYGADKFATVLLVIANMVAGMFQDPSIGKYKAYYVITKIFHIKSVENELGFTDGMGTGTKLNKLAAWAAKYISKKDSDPEHFDVFSFLSDKIVGGRALANQMCKRSNGNINSDVGLQSALIVAHEIGHNMWLDHDTSPECPGGTYIMSASLPGGPYATTWSNCSRRVLEQFIGSKSSACMNDSPFSDSIQTLPIADQKKLPGEIFDGDYQCRVQYGSAWRLSPFRQGVCGSLFCIKDGTELSRRAPMADGSTCGIRNWCIGGKCEDNGKKRIDGKWSDWSAWNSQCTRACGGGVQYRTRQCTNPPPTYGGKDCEGLDKQWRICNSAPCAVGIQTLRQQQCSEKVPGSFPFNRGTAFLCSLFCRSGAVVAGKGGVADGTRCYFDIKKLDVCIGGQCRRVGCDSKLDSLAMLDRCGVCGGDGDTCVKVTGNYTNTHTEIGPENADLIIELVVGVTAVVFQMRKSTNNYLGVQTKNGTYLVGGHLGKSQTVNAAGTTIVYTHKKNKYKDVITIAGPSDAVLRVMYIFKKGVNPGLDYSFVRPALPGDPKGTYEWLTTDWSSCSATCGHGVRTRLVRCIRSDDQSPASDNGCSGKPKPASQERCPGINCPSYWYTTRWSDCSKSCGNGQQTREVKCIMEVTLNEYEPSDNCSSNKTVITDTVRPCNSFACDPDWDTKEGLDRDECGDPIDPLSLFCYRMDQLGKRSLVPPLMCHQIPKPTRLPCTTPSPPPTTSTPPPTTELPKTTKTVKKTPSQAIQAQCSLLLTTLTLLLHLTCAA